MLVLSQHLEPKAAALLLSRNPTAVGYLLKERVSHLDEFVSACRIVAGGGVVIDPLVTEQLVRGGHDDEVIARLTDREREVLDFMAQGRSNAAIAQESTARRRRSRPTSVRSSPSSTCGRTPRIIAASRPWFVGSTPASSTRACSRPSVPSAP